jgi:environmental stress-induced protein Ves
MAWRLITVDSLVPTPWKNGGGTTREVLKFPPDSTIDTFDWRISLASVATPGPFSLFPQIDRTLLVTDGAGIELESFALTPSDEPFSFPGEHPYHATLIDGPIADFNVMTRRTRYAHSVRRYRAGGTSASHGRLRVIVSLSNGLTCAIGAEAIALGRLDSLLIDGMEHADIDAPDWLEVDIEKL